MIFDKKQYFLTLLKCVSLVTYIKIGEYGCEKEIYE